MQTAGGQKTGYRDRAPVTEESVANFVEETPGSFTRAGRAPPPKKKQTHRRKLPLSHDTNRWCHTDNTSRGTPRGKGPPFGPF